MRIEVDDLTKPDVHQLLEEHLSNMYEWTPADIVFALDLEKLRVPEITFWTAWNEKTLLGCGALKQLSLVHGEIKSMRTPRASRRRGAGRALLDHILREAQTRGYTTVSLETGAHPGFQAAHALYRSVGFEYSGPFGSYEENPYSIFMSRRSGTAAQPPTVQAATQIGFNNRCALDATTGMGHQ